jgi:large subunit ribosomal protein L29
MKAEKIRTMSEAEQATQLQQENDELHKLRFQLRMGQTESLKKIRGLRKDVARLKTIARETSLAAAKSGKENK